MVTKKNTELKVGIVTILAVIIFIIGIMLAKGWSGSVVQHTVKFRFNNSGGLQISNPVVVNGVKRGNVTLVANNNRGVLVEAAMDNVDDIMSDASAKITILEITGGKKIELNPGQYKHNFDLNNEIPGVNAFDLADMVSTVGGLGVQAVKLLDRLDTLAEKINYMFNKNNLADRINNIVVNADATLLEAKNLLISNRENIDITLRNMKSLTSDLKRDYAKYEPKLDTLMTNLEDALTSVKKLLIKADTSLTSVNLLLADARGITSEIKSGNGIISRLIYDKALSSKVDSTLKEIDDFLQMIKLYGVNVNIRLGTRGK